MHSAENGLSQEFRHLLDGFERSSEHIVVTDKAGCILFANVAAATHTGYQMEEMMGKKPGEVWGGNMPPEWYANMWQIIAGQKEAFVGDMHNRRKNGEMYWQRVHIIPVLDDRDAVQYYIGIELEIDVQSHREEVMHAAADIDPTAPITVRWPIGWLFEKGHLSHQELLDLQRQYEKSDALDQLTDDLLALSGVHAADNEPAEDFFLNELLQDIVAELRWQYPDRKMVVESTENEVGLHHKKRLVRLVLQKIITNAVQYTQPGAGEIMLLLLCAGNQCTVRCQDNGIGISFQEQQHLFEKFFRGTRAKVLYPRGAGLGLFLVKSIADSRGWDVRCVSEEDHGARFDVTMPLQDA